MKKVLIMILVAVFLIATPVQAKRTVAVTNVNTTLVGGMQSLLDDIYKLLRSLL